jgi:MFS family permease
MTASATRDRRVVYATAFLRATTTSTIGVTSGAYLATLGLDPTALGAVISCGLAGAAVAALLATFTADRVGRPRRAGSPAPRGSRSRRGRSRSRSRRSSEWSTAWAATAEPP